MLPRLLCLLLAALVLASCGGDDAASDADGVAVVATTTQLGDLAGAVAGDRAAVTQLLGPNADPHDYEPRPSDAAALSDADVVLQSGGELDEWLGELIETAGSDAERVEMLEAVRTIEGEEHAGEEEEQAGEEEEHAGEEEVDPHWWHDPRNAQAAVGRIRDALTAADPDGRDVYARNARALDGRIGALDEAIAACMAGIPEQDRRLVTDHDALGYFADRYDIEVVGTVIPALSTQAQASAGDVAELVRTIEREDVGAVFPSTSVGSDVGEAIAREAGARVGDPLYADTLGAEGTPGATYLGALRANAAAIAEGLGGDCDLPAG